MNGGIFHKKIKLWFPHIFSKFCLKLTIGKVLDLLICKYEKKLLRKMISTEQPSIKICYIFSAPLRSKGVLILIPGVHVCVHVHVRARGLLGSVLAFTSFSQQL